MDSLKPMIDSAPERYRHNQHYDERNREGYVFRIAACNRAHDKRQQQQYDQRIIGGREHGKRRHRHRCNGKKNQTKVNLGDHGFRRVEQYARTSPNAAGDRRGQDVETSPRSRPRDIRIGGDIPSIAVDAKSLMNEKRGSPRKQGGMRYDIPHHGD